MAEIRCAVCNWPLSSINEPCPRCLPGAYGRHTRLEADAIASVALDAGDTQVELDYKAAVRDLAPYVEKYWRLAYPGGYAERSAGDVLRKHAAAIAAARSET